MEVDRLSTIIVDKEPFVFLHDLEKAASLRMDECLSMICIKGEFPFDTESTHLDTLLLPLGDSVLDTVKLINEEMGVAEQKDVSEEDFQATQAQVVAHRTALPRPTEDAEETTTIVDERRSSINLYATDDQDVQDRLQEDVLDMDAWAVRTGGQRKAFGPQAALAHDLGKLPPGDVCIVHKDYSPFGHYDVFALKALSKVLCLSTISQSANAVILVKQTLAMSVFSTGFRGKVLAHVGINQGLGQTDPAVITENLLQGQLPESKKRKKMLVKRLMKDAKRSAK